MPYYVRKADGTLVEFADDVPRDVALAQVDEQERPEVMHGEGPLQGLADTGSSLVGASVALPGEALGGIASALGFQDLGRDWAERGIIPGGIIGPGGREGRRIAEEPISSQRRMDRALTAPLIGNAAEAVTQGLTTTQQPFAMQPAAYQDALAKLMTAEWMLMQHPESIPGGLADALAQSAPSTAPMFVAGPLAQAAGAGPRTTMALSGGLEGSISGGYASAQIDESIADFAAFNPQAFIESDLGSQALREANGDYRRAVAIAAGRAKSFWPIAAGALTATISRVGVNPFSTQATSRQAAQFLLNPIRTGIVREAGEETLQSAQEQLMQNMAVRGVNEELDPMEGVHAAGAMGGFGGGILGGVLGARHHLRGDYAPEDVDDSDFTTPPPGAPPPDDGPRTWSSRDPNDPENPVTRGIAGALPAPSPAAAPDSDLDAMDGEMANGIYNMAAELNAAEVYDPDDNPIPDHPADQREMVPVPLYRSITRDDIESAGASDIKSIYDGHSASGRDPTQSQTFSAIDAVANSLYTEPRQGQTQPDGFGVVIRDRFPDGNMMEYLFEVPGANSPEEALAIATGQPMPAAAAPEVTPQAEPTVTVDDESAEIETFTEYTGAIADIVDSSDTLAKAKAKARKFAKQNDLDPKAFAQRVEGVFNEVSASRQEAPPENVVPPEQFQQAQSDRDLKNVVTEVNKLQAQGMDPRDAIKIAVDKVVGPEPDDPLPGKARPINDNEDLLIGPDDPDAPFDGAYSDEDGLSVGTEREDVNRPNDSAVAIERQMRRTGGASPPAQAAANLNAEDAEFTEEIGPERQLTYQPVKKTPLNQRGNRKKVKGLPRTMQMPEDTRTAAPNADEEKVIKAHADAGAEFANASLIERTLNVPYTRAAALAKKLIAEGKLKAKPTASKKVKDSAPAAAAEPPQKIGPERQLTYQPKGAKKDQPTGKKVRTQPIIRMPEDVSASDLSRINARADGLPDDDKKRVRIVYRKEDGAPVGYFKSARDTDYGYVRAEYGDIVIVQPNGDITVESDEEFKKRYQKSKPGSNAKKPKKVETEPEAKPQQQAEEVVDDDVADEPEPHDFTPYAGSVSDIVAASKTETQARSKAERFASQRSDLKQRAQDFADHVVERYREAQDLDDPEVFMQQMIDGMKEAEQTGKVPSTPLTKRTPPPAPAKPPATEPPLKAEPATGRSDEEIREALNRLDELDDDPYDAAILASDLTRKELLGYKKRHPKHVPHVVSDLLHNRKATAERAKTAKEEADAAAERNRKRIHKLMEDNAEGVARNQPSPAIARRAADDVVEIWKGRKIVLTDAQVLTFKQLVTSAWMRMHAKPETDPMPALSGASYDADPFGIRAMERMFEQDRTTPRESVIRRFEPEKSRRRHDSDVHRSIEKYAPRIARMSRNLREALAFVDDLVNAWSAEGFSLTDRQRLTFKFATTRAWHKRNPDLAPPPFFAMKLNDRQLQKLANALTQKLNDAGLNAELVVQRDAIMLKGQQADAVYYPMDRVIAISAASVEPDSSFEEAMARMLPWLTEEMYHAAKRIGSVTKTQSDRLEALADKVIFTKEDAELIGSQNAPTGVTYTEAFSGAYETYYGTEAPASLVREEAAAKLLQVATARILRDQETSYTALAKAIWRGIVKMARSFAQAIYLMPKNMRTDMIDEAKQFVADLFGGEFASTPESMAAFDQQRTLAAAIADAPDAEAVNDLISDFENDEWTDDDFPMPSVVDEPPPSPGIGPKVSRAWGAVKPSAPKEATLREWIRRLATADVVAPPSVEDLTWFFEQMKGALDNEQELAEKRAELAGLQAQSKTTINPDVSRRAVLKGTGAAAAAAGVKLPIGDVTTPAAAIEEVKWAVKGLISASDAYRGTTMFMEPNAPMWLHRAASTFHDIAGDGTVITDVPTISSLKNLMFDALGGDKRWTELWADIRAEHFDREARAERRVTEERIDELARAWAPRLGEMRRLFTQLRLEGEISQLANRVSRTRQQQPGQTQLTETYSAEAMDRVINAGASLAREQAPDVIGEDGQPITDPGAMKRSVRAAFRRRIEKPMPAFAGVGSKNLTPRELHSLEAAKKMAERGMDRVEIWRKTRWAQTRNGKWAKRLDLRDIRLTDAFYEWLHLGKNTKKRMKLGALVDSTRLYNAYPDLRYANVVLDYTKNETHLDGDNLKNSIIRIGLGTGGLWEEVENTDELRFSDERARKLIVHEINHLIQDMEGFERGASIQEFELKIAKLQDTYGRVAPLFTNLAREYEPDEFDVKKAGYTEAKFQRAVALYLAVEGEVASREAEDALNFTHDQMARKVPDFLIEDTISADKNPPAFSALKYAESPLRPIINAIPAKVYDLAAQAGVEAGPFRTAKVIVDELERRQEIRPDDLANLDVLVADALAAEEGRNERAAVTRAWSAMRARGVLPEEATFRDWINIIANDLNTTAEAVAKVVAGNYFADNAMIGANTIEQIIMRNGFGRRLIDATGADLEDQGDMPMPALTGKRSKKTYNPPGGKFGAAINPSKYANIPDQPGYLEDVNDINAQLRNAPTFAAFGTTIPDKTSKTPFFGGALDAVDKVGEATLRAGRDAVFRSLGQIVPGWARRFVEGYFPFGGVPDRVALESYRALAQGRVGQAQDIATSVANAVRKAYGITPEEALRVLKGDYTGVSNEVADRIELARVILTARKRSEIEAAATELDNQELVDTLLDARQTILDVGRALVEHHIIHKKQFMSKAGKDDEDLDSVWGGYLRRAYIEHFEEMRPSAGIRASGANYRKFRQTIPEGKRLLKGEINDIPTLIYLSIEEPLRDIAIYNYFNSIMHHSMNAPTNPRWFLPESVVMFGGKVRSIWYVAQQKALNDESLNDKRKQLINLGGKKASGRAATRLENEINLLEQQSQDMEAHIRNHPDYAAALDEGQLPKGYRQIPTNPAVFGDAAGAVVMKQIYDDIMGGAKTINLDRTDPQNIAKNFYLALNRLTKFLYTVANPPTHFRNFYSNLLQLQRSGTNVARIIPAALDIVEYAKTGKASPAIQVALKYGAMKQSFTEAEVRAMDEFMRRVSNAQKQAKAREFWDGTPLGPVMDVVNTARFFTGATVNWTAEKASAIYQMGDVWFKVAKIADELDRGQPDALAALEARKYFFDYSAVSPWVRFARNWALAPFLSYIYFAIPTFLDTATTAPWRLAPAYMMYFGLMAMAASMFGFGDDEARKALHPGLENRAGLALVPDRDEYGRLQHVDFGYMTPEGSLVQAVSDVARGDVNKAVSSIGFTGGPLLAMATARATGIDPFRQTEIWHETDDEATKNLKFAAYGARTFMPSIVNYFSPPILAEDAGGNGYEALWGAGIDRYGQPTQTDAQVAARAFGLNVYPNDFNRGRERRVFAYTQQMELAERRLRAAMYDRRNFDENGRLNERGQRQMDYRSARVQAIIEDMQQYVEETAHAAEIESQRERQERAAQR